MPDNISSNESDEPACTTREARADAAEEPDLPRPQAAVLADLHAETEALSIEYGKAVYWVAYRITWSAQDAEDVQQLTYMQYYRTRLTKVIPNRRAWLFRTARNRAIDLVRARKYPTSLDELVDDGATFEPVAPDPSPHDVAYARHIEARVAEELSKLDTLKQAAWNGKQLLHIPDLDLADQLGVKVPNLRWHLHKVKAQMREALADLVEAIS